MHRLPPTTLDQTPPQPTTTPTAPTPKLTVGRLAAAWGVAPESLRNWERQGLIPPSRRTPGGHRRYRPDHVAALSNLLGPPKSGILPGPTYPQRAHAEPRPLAAVA